MAATRYMSRRADPGALPGLVAGLAAAFEGMPFHECEKHL
jgi:hypothetical protein